MNSGTSGNTFENVEDDIIFNPNNRSQGKSPTAIHEAKKTTTPDTHKVMPKDMSPKKIMDILYAREDATERAYTESEFQDIYIHDDGREAVIMEKPSPSRVGHKVKSVSDGVSLIIYSKDDLVRNLSIGDKVKFTWRTGGVSSEYVDPSYDFIIIYRDEISLIGRGIVP